LFEKDDRVDVTGTSKGKGFAGVMKRHGFSGFMASHGVHESKRGPGSIGQSADPAKVFKGMKMPGQMGNETVTIQNLRIVDVRESQNLILLKGPVPGGKDSLLVITHATKKEAPAPRQLEPEEIPEEVEPDEAPVEGDPGTGEEATTAPDSEPETGSGTESEPSPEEDASVKTDAEDREAHSEPAPEPELRPEPDAEAESETVTSPGEGDDEENKKN
jgi:hypothetical protein